VPYLSRLLFILALLPIAAGQPSFAQERSITVFAAASLKNALDDINAAYTAKTGVKVTPSYAASSALARQIERGAPADIFASADLEWMDYAVAKKTINEVTRMNLLGNKLVLIAPKDSAVANVAIGQGFDLAKLAGDGRIATGDVQAVPVGRYAKAALETLGAWNSAASKFAFTDNVRSALTLVARSEAPLGIVYETDAKVEPGVKIVGAFPASSHPAIVYPFAATANAKKDAEGYLAFVRSAEGKAVFEKYGFAFLIRPVS
jgi:molybdate transport system substrate-binding protein